MPCGGIWTPEPGSMWISGPSATCWICNAPCCDLFCDEWDTPLHRRCLGAFLLTEEGRLMLLDHGHGIVVTERPAAALGCAVGTPLPVPVPPPASAAPDDRAWRDELDHANDALQDLLAVYREQVPRAVCDAVCALDFAINGK